LRQATRRAALAAAALLLPGCATLPFLLHPPPSLAPCPGELVPTGEIPGDLFWRERVRVVGGDVDAGFELAVQKRGDELVVVGFNEFGAQAFSAVQRGAEVELRSELGRALAVPPGNLLRDLHRARFGAAPGGRVEVAREGERVEIENPRCGYRAVFVRVPAR
jgi:hypothetical protein